MTPIPRSDPHDAKRRAGAAAAGRVRRAALACLLAVALAHPVLAQAALAQTAALTYADALRHAEAAPSVLLAERTLELARRQLTVTAAPVRGELSTGYRWTWGERDLGAAGTSDLDDAGFDAIALSLSFPVLGLGPSGDAIGRARADVARAEAELAAARRAARIDVTNAFQRVLRAHAARALATGDVAYAVRQREALELSEAAGAASAPDVERARLAEDRARRSLAATEVEVAMAERTLVVVLGADLGAPTGPLPAPDALTADAEAAWARRPDVLAATLQVAETDRTADATLRDNLPTAAISLSGSRGDGDANVQFGAAFDTRSFTPSVNVGYDFDSGLAGIPSDGRSESFSVALTLRIPLDPTVGSAVAAARVGRDRAAAQLELALDRAELDVDQRRFELDAALADADLARASADLAAADLDLADVRFAAGSLSELALLRARLDAERAELDAQRALDAARLAALRLLDALAVDPAGDAAPQE